MLKPLCLSLCIIVTSSIYCFASDFDENKFQNDFGKEPQLNNKRIAQGVYLVVHKGTIEPRSMLMHSFTKRAISLTRRKGYNRFAVFNDVEGDGDLNPTLEKAIRDRKVRAFYMRRIKQKSPQMGQVSIRVKTRNGLVSIQKVYGIVVMMKGGKLGLPAKNTPYFPSRIQKRIEKEAKAAADTLFDKVAKEFVKRNPVDIETFENSQSHDKTPPSSTKYFFRGIEQ